MMAGKATAGAGGGTESATVGTVADNKNGSNMQSNSPQSGVDPKAVGVQGMRGLELNDGVLTSKGKNVKLSDGVRMIVHVDIFG
jgi:hypothetical protein